MIHLQTQITSTVAEVDEAGNVIRTMPLSVTLQIFSAESFAQGFAMLAQERYKLEEAKPR